VIERDFEVHLRKYSDLYVQIGVLEKLLRVTIPRSLGSDPYDPLDLDWMEKLPVDPENESRYRKALVRRKLERRNRLLNITDLLPFSFWKNILHGRNYTSTWIPFTHTILGPVSDAKSLVVFREFDAHLYQAHKDRNFIAHYNTSAIKGVDASLENVRWLQSAMGLVEAE
jgi:hypothetical protein